MLKCSCITIYAHPPQVVSLHITEKCLAPLPPWGIDKFSLRLFSPGWLSSFYQPLLVWQMLCSLNNLQDPSLDFLQHVHVSFVLGSSALDPALQIWPWQHEIMGKDHPLDLLAMLFLTQPRRPLVFSTRAYYWLMFILVGCLTLFHLRSKHQLCTYCRYILLKAWDGWCCPCSGLAYGARLVCHRTGHWPRTGRNHTWNGWDCWYLEHSLKSLMRLSTIYQRPGLLPWCPCCWLGSYTIPPFICQSCSWERLVIRDQTLLHQFGWIADELAIAVGMEAKRCKLEIQSGPEGWDSQLLWAFQRSGEEQGQWLGTSE